MYRLRIRPTGDGFYSIFRDSSALVTGLSREQADAFARVYRLPRDFG